jgi:hypothetical protein
MSKYINELRNGLNVFKKRFSGLSQAERIRLLDNYKSDKGLTDIYETFKLINWETIERMYPDRIDAMPGVTYTNILEDKEEFYSGGVFFVSKGYELPLHDHRGMLVFSKTLYGNVMIEAFGTNDADSKGLMEVNRVQHIELKQGETAVLTPSHNNLHKVTGIQNSAFFDVLIPHYTPENECCYYNIIERGSKKYIKKINNYLF